MSHRSHTEAEPFRYGVGDLAEPWMREAAARQMFLECASTEYPGLAEDVMALSAHFPREYTLRIGGLPFDLYWWLRRWAYWWGLTKNGADVVWAIEAALASGYRYRKTGTFAWIVAAGGVTPTFEPESLMLSNGDFYDPRISVQKIVKARVPRSLHGELTKILHAVGDAGMPRTGIATSDQLEPFRWAVWHQVGRQKYIDIARTSIGWSNCKDDDAAYDHTRVVTVQVHRIAKVVGLDASDRRGRPKG